MRGGGNGRSRLGVLVVRNETRLFAEVLAEALKGEPAVRLLDQPLTLEAALAFCRDHRPDVVLIEATEAPPTALRTLVGPIRSACDSAPVVLLADQVIDDTFLVAGLEAGASGVVDASEGVREVLRMARAAAEGKQPVDPQRVVNAVEGAARKREQERMRSDLLGLLSDREREVLGCLTRGMRNSEIADELSISPRTVEKHVHHILAKLEVPSRLAAVALAAETGDLTYEDMSGTG